MEIDINQRRFRWALVLAWVPWIPTWIGLGPFIGINNQKATGLAALAGGMAEMYVLWGVATLVTAQVVAIIWFVRSFSRDNSFRNLISFVSVCASGLMLLITGGFLWVVRYFAHH